MVSTHVLVLEKILRATNPITHMTPATIHITNHFIYHFLFHYLPRIHLYCTAWNNTDRGYSRLTRIKVMPRTLNYHYNQERRWLEVTRLIITEGWHHTIILINVKLTNHHVFQFHMLAGVPTLP